MIVADAKVIITAIEAVIGNRHHPLKSHVDEALSSIKSQEEMATDEESNSDGQRCSDFTVLVAKQNHKEKISDCITNPEWDYSLDEVTILIKLYVMIYT